MSACLLLIVLVTFCFRPWCAGLRGLAGLRVLGCPRCLSLSLACAASERLCATCVLSVVHFVLRFFALRDGYSLRACVGATFLELHVVR